MDDAIALEDDRETVVVPARDRRLRLRASADRGMAGGRRAELLLDLVHGEAAFRPIELRLAHLYRVVDDEGFGDRGARPERLTVECVALCVAVSVWSAVGIPC